MNREHTRTLLEGVRNGSLSIDDGLERLACLPVMAAGEAHVDTHRALRCGFAEVIFGEGKTPDELVTIARSVLRQGDKLLVTRVSSEGADALIAAVPEACHHERCRLVTVGLPAADEGHGSVLVLSAGTADTPVAQEAELTARLLGARVERLSDVGVAGIHRVLAHVERIRAARVVVVVAGMEGALPSVVGGLVERPVIAVPTSVGYGTSFEGVTALLSMMNTCAAGVTVVNIDNGFGAGYAAAQINRMEGVPAR